jgi:hypothetical protein
MKANNDERSFRRQALLIGYQSSRLWLLFVCMVANTVYPTRSSAESLDQLTDLTDSAAQAVVTLKGRDNFNSEYAYDVSVKNFSSDSLVGDSLVVVLDRVTNIGGDDWASGTSQSNLSRMEILGQDGETDDGKPYFHIPRGSVSDLPPYKESRPATVRIRNKDYLIVFTPVFKVYGQKRVTNLPKPAERQLPPERETRAEETIQLLIQKGAISAEEGQALRQR